MNKTLLIQKLTESLRENFETLQRSSQKTRSAGNDDESKSEGKYDTRSTEENYLADGLAKQAFAAAQTMAACQNMPLLSFNSTTPIALSALVLVEFPEETQWFFLAPAAGGTEIVVEDAPITILTPDSPLGAQLIGLKVGDHTKSPRTRVLSVE